MVHIKTLVMLQIWPGLLVASSVRNRSPVFERVDIFRHRMLLTGANNAQAFCGRNMIVWYRPGGRGLAKLTSLYSESIKVQNHSEDAGFHIMLAGWSSFTSGSPRDEHGAFLTLLLNGKLLWGEKILNQHVFVRHTFYVHCPDIEFGALVVRSRRQSAWIFGPTWRDFLLHKIVQFDVSVCTTRGRRSRVLIQTFYTKYHPH